MHTYRQIEKRFDLIKDEIETGLRQAKLTRDLLPLLGIKNFSHIRACSFEINGNFHLEVRWDWENDKLLTLIGSCRKNHRKAVFNCPVDRAVDMVAKTLLEVAEGSKRGKLTVCRLGE